MLALALLGSAATVMSKVAPFAAEPDEGSNRRYKLYTNSLERWFKHLKLLIYF